MQVSSERILTTHIGSLPQPRELRARLEAASGAPPTRELDEEVVSAVKESLSKQTKAGVIVGNDGEQGKSNWAAYVHDRLNGLAGENIPRPGPREAADFPDFWPRGAAAPAVNRPACNGPLSWKDFSAVEKDIANLKAAAAEVGVREVFMSSSSPGNVSNFHPNHYYPSEEQYLQVIADVMQREYEAVADAGIVLQLDCPDLAIQTHYFPDATDEEFRKIVQMRIEALNHATRNIPPESMRIHICWGRTESARLYDQPLKNLVDLYLTARPAGLSIVGCNGRHEYEWRVWQDVKLPDGKVLLPGVIDNTSGIIEHPETVAERISRYANLVGRERVIASVNCGFGNVVTSEIRDERVVWAKLKALADGAALATERLWGRGV
jgi:5-methyltetrahydropteroyltriglutamate--homocysteine methyltransferase